METLEDEYTTAFDSKPQSTFENSFKIHTDTISKLLATLEDNNTDVYNAFVSFIGPLDPSTVFDQSINDIKLNVAKKEIKTNKFLGLSDAEKLARLLPRIFSGEFSVKSKNMSKQAMDLVLAEFFVKVLSGCTTLPAKDSEEAVNMAKDLQNCIFVGSDRAMEPLLDKKYGLPIFLNFFAFLCEKTLCFCG